MRKKKLNTRQWDLYNYLKEVNCWQHLDDIASAMNYASKRVLTADLRAIKNNDTTTKCIIFSNTYGVKIADSVEEYAEYSKKQWDRIKKMIKLQLKQDKKATANNQYRLTFTKYEKDLIEAFNNEELL